MARYYNNTACPLYNTEYCRMLNMMSCETCTVAGRDKASMEALKVDLDAIKALLPEDGVEDLFLTDHCVLCKKEKPNPRAYYALLDLGNREPERVERNFLGIKTKLRTGSLLPVQLASCDACKKRFTKLELTVPVATGLTGAISIMLLSYRPLREALAAFGAAVPFLCFAGVMLASWLIPSLVIHGSRRRFASLTHLDVMEVPKMKELKERGWFELNPHKRYSRLIFSKKRLKQGLYTGKMEKSAPGA